MKDLYCSCFNRWSGEINFSEDENPLGIICGGGSPLHFGEGLGVRKKKKIDHFVKSSEQIWSGHQRWHSLTMLFVLFNVCIQFNPATCFSQQIPKNKYGLPVVNDVKLFKALVAADSNKKMIDLQTMIPDLRMDVKYATRDNYFHRRLYPYAKCFFRSDAAKALKAVEVDLNKMGLGLKVFDSYRPYSITVQIWEMLPDSTYAASPWKGSGHNCGAAIDLTLINLKTGEELPMPSDYDEPTERAWHGYAHADSARTANRATLRSVMERHGFVMYPYEWWHYFFGADWKQRYEVLDLSFDELTDLQKK